MSVLMTFGSKPGVKPEQSHQVHAFLPIETNHSPTAIIMAPFNMLRVYQLYNALLANGAAMITDQKKVDWVPPDVADGWKSEPPIICFIHDELEELIGADASWWMPAESNSVDGVQVLDAFMQVYATGWVFFEVKIGGAWEDTLGFEIAKLQKFIDDYVF